MSASVQVIHGDCLDVLRTLPACSVDAVITDPPYAEIDRDYGRLTEQTWAELMHAVVGEVRRVLKPTGSAVFILQPNSERMGRMRLWVWKFLVWLGEEWNIIQDVYWWNFTAIPTRHANRQYGLLRPSVKYCVWTGAERCYRNQERVLWKESQRNIVNRLQGRAALRYFPSGGNMRSQRCSEVALERGGVTPLNLLPFSNTNSATSAGSYGHGAGTPLEVCSWWVRYLTPPGGVVLDPFVGSGSTLVAAMHEGVRAIGIEKEAKYITMCQQRIAEAREKLGLFAPQQKVELGHE